MCCVGQCIIPKFDITQQDGNRKYKTSLTMLPATHYYSESLHTTCCIMVNTVSITVLLDTSPHVLNIPHTSIRVTRMKTSAVIALSVFMRYLPAAQFCYSILFFWLHQTLSSLRSDIGLCLNPLFFGFIKILWASPTVLLWASHNDT
jgi:hypothetical protein